MQMKQSWHLPENQHHFTRRRPTMEKNNFLIYNDIVYTLYQCKSYEALRDEFLPRLRLLIPFTYASIISVNPENRTEIVPTPVCFPDYFYEAELLYIDHMSEDHLLWINNVRESQLVRESDLVNDDVRLNSSLYQHCYQKFHVYDSLQYSMICSGEFSGILTLFRTKIDGDFTDDDVFFFRSLGKHINVTYEQILYPEKEKGHTALANRIPALAKGYDLTPRETEILSLIFSFANNDEIAATLGISENTIQKHLQNIFRKTGTSSKWDLLRLS